MEFQVYSVALEDRYPPGLVVSNRKEAVCVDGFLNELRRTYVEKEKEGCVAFVFGRAQDGRSVCVRVEGVCPKLYYEMDADDTTHTIRQELESEVREKLMHGSIYVEKKRFAHGYGYEYDGTTSSGRKVHDYVEASYPSMSSWRLACQLRRNDMLRDVRSKIRDAVSKESAIESRMLDIQKQLTTANSIDSDALKSTYRALDDQLKTLRTSTLVGLRRREKVLRTDDDATDSSIITNSNDTHSNCDISSETSRNEQSLPKLKKDHNNKKHRVAHEHFVEPLTRFLFEANITPSTWTRVPIEFVAVPVTLCDVELCATISDFVPLRDRELDAPYVTMYYDIETLGLDPETAQLIQVSAVFVCEGVRDRHLVAIGTVDPITNVTIHECADESELLSTFRCLIVRKDPDFVVAYNGVNFDNRFLAVRANKLNETSTTSNYSLSRRCMSDVSEFWFTSRFALRPASLRELHLQSSGMGDNMIRYVEMTGRATFDWFVKLKRDLTSEPQYSLNHFAKKLCGSQKEDVHHSEIPVLHGGTSADRARLGKYCVVDSELLEDLNVARTMIGEILQFSAVFGVLPEWVYFRGQQVRFASILLRKARTCESIPLVLNRPAQGYCGELTASFEGATVNEPKHGFYKKPVATLDWASLYPSIMRAHNLCHSTHVLDYVKNTSSIASVRTDRVALPHDICTDRSIDHQEKGKKNTSTSNSTADDDSYNDDGIVEHRISSDFVAYFASAKKHRGVLPRILEELHAQRKAAKAKSKAYMVESKKSESTPDQSARCVALAKVWDGRQLALKISMNSIYGACGATDTGKYPDIAVSATVTMQGRRAMVVKKQILPERFPGIDIIYGDTDSVMVTFADADDVATCAIRGEEASVFVTSHFASIGYSEMILEFEKIYCPYLLEGKKRYAGLKFEPGGGGGSEGCDAMVAKGIDCKGIETERRDTLPFVRDVMHGCLEILMYQKDEKMALQFFESKMGLLVDDRIAFDQFVMRKNLSAKVEGKIDVCVQARVNALRRSRESGSEASTNEQVEYVIVNGPKKEKTTLLAEDPAYARTHNLKLNRLWYFEHAIEPPIARLFAVFHDLDCKRVCNRVRAELDRERLCIDSSLKRMLCVESSMPPLTDVDKSSAVTSSSSSSTRPHIAQPPPAKTRRTTNPAKTSIRLDEKRKTRP